MLLFMDGFDSYRNTTGNLVVADLLPRWTSFLYENASFPMRINTGIRHLNAGFSIENSNSSTWAYLDKAIAPTGNVLICQFAYNLNNATHTRDMLNLLNGSALVGRFRFANGRLQYLNSAGAVLLESVEIGLPGDIWRHYGIRIDFSTGEVTFYIEGAQDATGIGLATGAIVPNRVRIGFQYYVFANPPIYGSNAGFVRYDDLVVMDGSGTRHNAYLGVMFVRGVDPASDVSGTGVQNTGTSRFSAVDDPTSDDDATFVTMADGATDLYGIPSASVPANVSAVGVYFRARREGVDPTTMAGAIKSGTVSGTGPAQLLSSTYEGRGEVFPVDPNTGGAWTQAAAQAAGYGVTAG